MLVRSSHSLDTGVGQLWTACPLPCQESLSGLLLIIQTQCWQAFPQRRGKADTRKSGIAPDWQFHPSGVSTAVLFFVGRIEADNTKPNFVIVPTGLFAPVRHFETWHSYWSRLNSTKNT